MTAILPARAKRKGYNNAKVGMNSGGVKVKKVADKDEYAECWRGLGSDSGVDRFRAVSPARVAVTRRHIICGRLCIITNTSNLRLTWMILLFSAGVRALKGELQALRDPTV